MNTMAFGDEIAEVAEATAPEGAKVAATTAGSDNGYGGGGFLQGSDGKFITTVAYNPESSKKNAKNNLAVITNTTDPVSWNNLNGAELIATVLFGGEADDEYLNNTDKFKVSKNEVPSDSNFPNNIVDKGWGYNETSWVFRSIPVDQSAGVYALVGYKFDNDGSDYVKGEWAYQDETVAPYFAAPRYVYRNDEGEIEYINRDLQDNESRITKIPVTTWSGRTLGLNKNGEGKYDADKKNVKNIDVQAFLVKFENGTVTELEDLDVKSIKWKDKKALKQASVKYATSEVEYKYKLLEDGKLVEKNDSLSEHDVIGTLPEFSIKVKAKNKDAKKYKKSFKNTLDKETFKVGIMQKAIEVWDPTGRYTGSIVTEFNTNGENKYWKTNDKNVNEPIPASSNGDYFTDMVKNINSDFSNAGYAGSDLKPGDNAIGGLTITKFEAKKNAKGTIILKNEFVKKGDPQGGKNADVTLKKGKDYDFVSGTLAGGETVYALDLNGNNYIYKNSDPADGGLDLSAFGFKWAFREDPKDKKTFRYGIYADTNVGFVFGK